ncbi:MAG: PPC domain-containing protein [Planctomycetes bacterium]|nr:PPC domain-containing protein [Planctomycetota bacterium]
MPSPIAVLLAAMGCLALCPAQAPGENEPNDRAADAQALAVGQRIGGTLASTADVDWYRFELTAPGRVQLRLATTNLPWQAPRDALLAIYDAAGGRRLAWNERAEGTGCHCGVTLPAGQYACLVAMKASGIPGSYTLDLAVAAPQVVDVREAGEPNDPPSGGQPTPFRLGATIAGELATPGDVDWFAFEVDADGVAQVLCLDDGGAPQLDNTRLQFWHEVAAGRWARLGAPSYVRTSHRAVDLAHTTDLPAGNHLTPGRYAIQVDGDTSTPAGTAPWDYRKVGHYALRTAWIAFADAAPLAEAAEPNDTDGAALVLSPGRAVRGTIGADGDADRFRLEVTVPLTLAATAVGDGAEPLPVASVRLWSAAGAALASGTGTTTAHGRLVHTIHEPGSYFLEVRGRRFGDTGGYLLRTGTCAPLQPTPPAPVASPTSAEPADAAVRPAEAQRNGPL